MRFSWDEAADEPCCGFATPALATASFLVLVGAACLGLAACSLPGPAPAEYVLGALPAAKPTAVKQKGLPVVEIKRVQLPDYLDTTDILERRGNQLIPSSTGRWGERLSLGMTRALTASLSARLPGVVVTASTVTRPARQILVDVAAFEVMPDHQVVFVARWTVLGGPSPQVHEAEQTSLVEKVSGDGDGAIVAAMSKAVDDLAGRLAAEIERDLRP